MAVRRRGPYLLLSGLVVFLDQASKALMTAYLAPRGSAPVIPGLFDLTYVHNTGAVFGLFRDLSAPWRGWLLTLVPLAAVGLILVLAMRTPPGRRRPLFALALILGGALGNLIDRLRFGSVVDFLDFYVGSAHWPAFNLADSAICIGVGLLLLDMSLQPSSARASSGPARTAGRDDPGAARSGGES